MAQPGKKGHGACSIDIDDDGDLDLYTQLGGHYAGDHAENALYKNLKGNTNNWLEIELAGTKSNRFAVGAAVTLTAGASKFYREVKGSEGFGATSSYRCRSSKARQLIGFFASPNRHSNIGNCASRSPTRGRTV
jgi:hypothetical protein